jgi:wyosine [tRNA(Phe)-imidazoG37] synthetase (radical SAM superfamily)
MPATVAASPPLIPAHRRHDRAFGDLRFVYPVLSRRSRGLSIGINLNPDRTCNFDCVYCQVDRSGPAGEAFVDLDQLEAELEQTIRQAQTGELFQADRFQDVPESLRRLNDIAFSGEGEPTTYANFDTIVGRVAGVKDRLGLGPVKLVLITNASQFHRPRVRRGIELLGDHQGEIWAKLDAGTEAWYRQVNRCAIPLNRIVANLTEAARLRPIVIQSLFLRLAGEEPSDAEVEAYCGRLAEIQDGGGTIDHVQVYTVARTPAEAVAEPLPDARLEAIAGRVRERTGLVVEVYGGTSAEEE